MTIRKRSAVMGVIAAFLWILYGTARINSTFLVEYVVEKTLIQKAPAGTDPVQIQESLQKLLAAAPNRTERLERLFLLSSYLEKVQEVSPQALAGILDVESTDIFIR